MCYNGRIGCFLCSKLIKGRTFMQIELNRHQISMILAVLATEAEFLKAKVGEYTKILESLKPRPEGCAKDIEYLEKAISDNTRDARYYQSVSDEISDQLLRE